MASFCDPANANAAAASEAEELRCREEEGRISMNSVGGGGNLPEKSRFRGRKAGGGEQVIRRIHGHGWGGMDKLQILLPSIVRKNELSICITVCIYAYMYMYMYICICIYYELLDNW